MKTTAALTRLADFALHGSARSECVHVLECIAALAPTPSEQDLATTEQLHLQKLAGMARDFARRLRECDDARLAFEALLNPENPS